MYLDIEDRLEDTTASADTVKTSTTTKHETGSDSDSDNLGERPELGC